MNAMWTYRIFLAIFAIASGLGVPTWAQELSTSESPPEVIVREKSPKDVLKCESSFIQCECGRNGSIVELALARCVEKDPDSGIRGCQICNRHAMTEDLCSKFLRCETCSAETKKCSTCPEEFVGDFCNQDTTISATVGEIVVDAPVLPQVPVEESVVPKTIEVVNASNDTILEEGDDKSSILLVDSMDLDSLTNGLENVTTPIRIKIKRGEPIRGNRFMRSDGCEYPTTMETADIDCIIYTMKIKCTQSCVWGHTLPEGKKKEIKCRYKENRWVPTYFEECQPYVDCNLKIATPGEMSCISNKMDSPPSCELSCSEYDDQPYVPLAKHECSLQGEWDPPLPHCIVKANDVELAQPPRE